MRILLVGAGGVGTAFARIAARRPFAELIVADYDLGRAQRAAAASDRFTAVRLDARDEQAVADLLTAHSADALMNATDPRFVMPLYRAATVPDGRSRTYPVERTTPHHLILHALCRYATVSVAKCVKRHRSSCSWLL